MVKLSNKIIYTSLHDFHMWCETLPQMTQFNEGKGWEGIRTINIFEFENARSYVKKCCDHWEKVENNMLDKSYTSTRDISLQKLPLLLTLQMNQSFNVRSQL